VKTLTSLATATVVLASMAVAQAQTPSSEQLPPNRNQGMQNPAGTSGGAMDSRNPSGTTGAGPSNPGAGPSNPGAATGATPPTSVAPGSTGGRESQPQQMNKQ
jgi:hypothetical protein